MVASIEIVPSAFLVNAGQPGLKQAPHFLHISGIGAHLVVNLLPFKSTHGDFVIITDTSSFATSYFTILSSSAISKASTYTTFLIPKDLQRW